MVDSVTPEKRSEMMSGIRSGNTKPEIVIRKALHQLGYRYRNHPKGMFGRPDFKMSKYKVVFFIHGCFWHGHDCHLFRMPKSRLAFWENKIITNRKRDAEVTKAYGESFWRLATIWECAIRGKDAIGIDKTINLISEWLESESKSIEIRGAFNGPS